MAVLQRILVVEDNPGDVYLLEQALAEHGVICEIDLAEDGEQALSILGRISSSRYAPPRMIVLDLNLPKVHGLQVLERAQAIPALSDVPVIVLTSSMSLNDKRSAEKLGAALFITKPSNINDYLAIGATLRKYCAEPGV